MIKFPGEAPSGDQTPSDERDITLLLPHKTSKGLTFYTGIIAIEKRSTFLRDSVDSALTSGWCLGKAVGSSVFCLPSLFL